jgi:YihY family inner membrane protein
MLEPIFNKLRVPQWLRKQVRVLLGTLDNFSRISASQLAAAFSYYAFFSIFPFIALLLWIGALFFSPEQVTETINEYFPVGGDTSDLVWHGVHALQKAHGTLNIAFAGVFLWASLKFFQSLVHGVNHAWCDEHLPWWQLPLKNFIMVLTVASALILGVLAPLLLQISRNVLVAAQDFFHIHFTEFDLPGLLPVVEWVRLLLASVVLFYAISVLYMLAPRVRVRFRQVWLAALVVSVLVQVMQVFFVNYLPQFVRYNVIYGAMGGVMFLLLWIYLTGIVILSGACWCAAAAKLNAGGTAKTTA